MSEALTVVKHLSAQDVAAWRKQGHTVSSRPGVVRRDGGAPEMEPEAEFSFRSRLHPRETYAAMIDQAWGGPEGQQASVRWLRTTVPWAVAHLSDEQLITRVDELIRASVERGARSRNEWKPVVVK